MVYLAIDITVILKCIFDSRLCICLGIFHGITINYLGRPCSIVEGRCRLETGKAVKKSDSAGT
jgi:hypothetical protein